MFFSCTFYPCVKKGLGHVAKHPGAWKTSEQEQPTHDDRCIFMKDLTFEVKGQHRLGRGKYKMA